VLRFENLTADPSLDWMGRAASEILIREIGAIPSASIYKVDETFGPRPVSAPGVSTEFTAALLAGANRVIEGYIEQDHGRLSFTAVEEDARTGKTLLSANARGSLFDACAALARNFSSAPKPYSSRSEPAVKDYIEGLEGASEAPLERAIAADPGYSDAYILYAESALAHGRPESVAPLLAQARTRHLDPLTLARLEVAEADAAKDPAARTAALARLVAADPADVSAIQALGDSQLAAHRFREAAATYAKAASPALPALFNLEAYALMFAHDERAAMSAVHNYQTARPTDPNAIDSQGDIEFYFGRFFNAEQSYLRSAAEDPNFNEGTELWKAARARLMTGDAAAASQVFARYRDARQKVNDPAVPYRSAYWLFLTGDRPAALEAMRKLASDRNYSLSKLALTQLTIWELCLGVRSAAPNTPPAYALLIGKRYAEAALAWKPLYEKSDPNDQDVAFLYAAALQQSGQSAAAASILRHNPIPQTALAPSFECLYFPQLFDWRGDHAAFLKLSGNTAAPLK
jgi:Flp pilus assembly protein TadD